MKVLLVLAILLAICYAKSYLRTNYNEYDTVDDGELFLSGFLKGLGQPPPYTDIGRCSKDMNDIITKFVSAFELLKKKGFDNAMNGVILLLQTVKDLLNRLTPCSEGFDQLKRLMTAMQKVDLLKLVFKIIADFGHFKEQFDNFSDNARDHKFEAAGINLGTILKDLFLASELITAKTNYGDVIKFMGGIIELVVWKQNLDGIARCVTTTASVTENINNVFGLLGKVEWNKLNEVDVILAISNIFRKAIISISPCIELVSELGNFFNSNH